MIGTIIEPRLGLALHKLDISGKTQIDVFDE
jgi:hypothetical protein